MKIKLSIILFLIVSITQLFAQIPNRGCATVVPDAQYDALFQQKVIDYLNQFTAANRTQATYQIPVIIHVIHNGEAVGTFPNLAKGQLNSQIQVLNDDYAGIGFNSGNYPNIAFQTYATNTIVLPTSKDGLNRIGISNTGITFCLATKDTLGNFLAEPGIERKHWDSISGASNPTTYTSSASFTTYMNTVVKPATIWSPNKYLNIWVSDATAGLLGFTTFPPLSTLTGSIAAGTATTDGLWCWAKTFGSQNIFSGGTYDPVYKYGRTATHELSHYFGIRHTWGDGSCLTDYCNDTPGQQAASSGGLQTYPYLPNNCTATVPPTGPEGVMFMNFADYTDDAQMYMFTNDQKIRMQTAMVNSPYRNLLGTHGLCSTTSSVVANFSISSTTICQGQTVYITDLSTPSSSITAWFYNCTGALPTSSTLQNPTFTFNTTGVFTISLTVSSSSLGNASTTKTIQVNAAPATTLNANTINPICNGVCNGSATITAIGASPFTYSWSPPISANTPIINSLCAGIYTCVVKNMCGISSTKTINIGQPPPLNISISVAGAPACFGNTVSLTSSVNGGIPPYTYNWNTGSTLSSITVTPSIMPTTVYTLNVTDSQGCFAPKSLSVAVNPVPSITVTPFNPTICDGKTASVNLSGALNYTTNPGGITVSSFTVNPSSTTIYTITGISPQGCFGFRNDTIKVNNLPPIFSNVNTNTVCLGSSVTFSNSGGLTYTLNPSSINGNIINVIPTVLGTTIFTVSGSGPFGCINTKTINITTFALPNVSISPANPTICSGKSIVLSGLGASTYTWSGTGSSGSSITVSPTANSTFSLIGTNSFGCINSASTIVNVIPTPIVSINSPTNVCFGYTMNIVASGATNYLWSNGATTDSIHVQPFSNITYNVIGNNGGSCSDTAFISLSVLPLPPVTASVNTTLACVGQTINLTASGAVNYLWKPNNFIGPNQTVQIFVPTTYTVYGKGSNGCAFFSTVSVNVKTGTSIIPVSTPSAVCIGDTSILSVIGGYVPLWSNNPIPNTTIATPTTNTSYTLSAIDFNGCTSDIVFYVGINADCDVVVFNSFTPNGDGINDFFSIDNIDKYPNNMVYIYNRWGNKIFNTTNYNNSNNNWDGKLNGKVVTAGTYFYIIVNENEKVFKKGWIEITN